MPDTKSLKFLSSGGVFDAVFIFSDGRFFLGCGMGCPSCVFGEATFNTSLSGYQETLTDPSYASQILIFTLPNIGNVGVNDLDNESAFVSASGVVIKNLTTSSNYRKKAELSDFLITQGVTGIYGVDTRAIVRHIKKNGHLNAAIFYCKTGQSLPIIQDKQGHYHVAPDILKEINAYPTLLGKELAISESQRFESFKKEGKYLIDSDTYQIQNKSTYRVTVINFGIKKNIIRSLNNQGLEVTVLPANCSFKDIQATAPDGVFLSNGPGDPQATACYFLPLLKKILEQHIPLFAICMGHELLALALGMKMFKMTSGHRGSNHPVKNLRTQRVEITSQNHGFCVSADHIPEDIEVTHISLFDKSIEGIKSLRYPAFSVQFHPESSPGPHDSNYLFDEFFDLIDKHAEQKEQNNA